MSEVYFPVFPKVQTDNVMPLEGQILIDALSEGPAAIQVQKNPSK